MNENKDAPAVGSLATYHIGSDCYPYTVIAMSPSGHRVTLQERKARRVDNNGAWSDCQTYITVDDDNGRTMTATRRKDGAYRAKGCSNYGRVTFGAARKHRDPSF